MPKFSSVKTYWVTNRFNTQKPIGSEIIIITIIIIAIIIIIIKQHEVS